jgi:ubiquitin-protein ligase E3 C
MFSNQELNLIISGANPDFSVDEMQSSTVYKDYHEKDETIIMFWQVLKELSCEEKSLLLLFVTSCSRPPTLGFASMKPRICINRDNDATHLPTANTCMNVLRLPNYKNKAVLKTKLLYAINAKAGFEFA